VREAVICVRLPIHIYVVSFRLSCAIFTFRSDWGGGNVASISIAFVGVSLQRPVITFRYLPLGRDKLSKLHFEEDFPLSFELCDMVAEECILQAVTAINGPGRYWNTDLEQSSGDDTASADLIPLLSIGFGERLKLRSLKL